MTSLNEILALVSQAEAKLSEAEEVIVQIYDVVAELKKGEK